MTNKTTPETVKEANWGLFRATMNLPAAADHCGMTIKEMKMTFREFLKYHEPDYNSQPQQLSMEDRFSCGSTVSD